MAAEYLEPWDYKKRRTMQEIIPGLYLGPYSAAMKSKLESLKAIGITHIVCVRNEQEAHIVKPNFEDTFKYLVLEINDSIYENIIKHFGPVKNFIESALDSGGKVLVHGNTGVSRSASLVVAYLMQKYTLSARKALEYVQTRRLCIRPNEGFIQQINEFEAICEAHNILGNNSSEFRNNKRRYDEL